MLYEKTQVEEALIIDLCETDFEPKKEIRFGFLDCDYENCIKYTMVEESGYKYNNLFLFKK